MGRNTQAGAQHEPQLPRASDADGDSDIEVWEPKPCEEIDSHGDLFLDIGRHPYQQSFRVCSRTLARCSPVFDMMLYGPFIEKRPLSREWRVSLPEDDPEAVRPVLQVLHHKPARQFEVDDLYDEFDHLHDKVDDLHDILVVTNKYQCTFALVPHANRFLPVPRAGRFLQDMEDIQGRLYDSPPSRELAPHMLAFAWELGYWWLFDSTMTITVMNVTLAAPGSTDIRTLSGDLSPLLPESIMKIIYETRAAAIRQMSQEVLAMQNCLEADNNSPLAVSCGHACLASVMSLTGVRLSADMWTKPVAARQGPNPVFRAEETCSIADLIQYLEDQSSRFPRYKPGAGHVDCALSVRLLNLANKMKILKYNDYMSDEDSDAIFDTLENRRKELFARM